MIGWWFVSSSLSGLGFMSMEHFHKTPIKFYWENGRNVQLCFYLLFYFMPITYDDLQIEGIFCSQLFNKSPRCKVLPTPNFWVEGLATNMEILI